MAKEKENKTNAMRILDKNKINYEVTHTSVMNSSTAYI